MAANAPPPRQGPCSTCTALQGPYTVDSDSLDLLALYMQQEGDFSSHSVERNQVLHFDKGHQVSGSLRTSDLLALICSKGANTRTILQWALQQF